MEGLLPMGVHRLAIYERMVLTFSSFLMPQNSRTLPIVENIYIYIFMHQFCGSFNMWDTKYCLNVFLLTISTLQS